MLPFLTLLGCALLYSFSIQSALIFNDVGNLTNLKFTLSQLSKINDMLFLIASVPYSTKIISINFTVPTMLACASYSINSDRVIAIVDDEMAVTYNFTLILLNTSENIIGIENTTMSKIYDINIEGMMVAVGDTARIVRYEDKFVALGEYKIPSDMISYAYGYNKPTIHYTAYRNGDYSYYILDYSTQKTVFQYPLNEYNKSSFRKIYVSADSHTIFLYVNTVTLVFVSSFSNYTLAATLSYNITQIEIVSLNKYAAKVANDDTILFINVANKIDITDTHHFNIELKNEEYQIFVKPTTFVIFCSKGVYVYSYESDSFKTFFKIEISFIIPLGFVILVMGATILVVCLRIKKKPHAPSAPIMLPQPVIQIRSDETIITEENKRISYGKLLGNLRKMLECSLSRDILRDPVLLCDGYTYERMLIEKWLNTNPISPVTRCPLANNTMIPNKQLRTFIDEWNQDEKQS